MKHEHKSGSAIITEGTDHNSMAVDLVRNQIMGDVSSKVGAAETPNRSQC